MSRTVNNGLTLVRIDESSNIEIAVLESGATQEEASAYLARVRAELHEAIIRVPHAMRHKIDLANGQRGGYFADAETAVTALLYEVVDSVRGSKTKPLKRIEVSLSPSS